MALPTSLLPEDIHHFHSVISHAMDVRSHFDILVWLQGDMQKYLPHDILIASWGDFQTGKVHHDLISAISGVRSNNTITESITPLVLQLFQRWNEFGKKPFSLKAGENGFSLDTLAVKGSIGKALRSMRCAMVHGITDERGSHDCLYIVFNQNDLATDGERTAFAMVLPHIDTALRQVEHLPHQSQNLQTQGSNLPTIGETPVDRDILLAGGLSQRETEIMKWVALGKTNPEIGSILEISSFTVKNHMQRVFKKLNVSNRAQAVGKIRAMLVND